MDFSTIQSNVETYLLDLPAATQALVPTFVNQAVREAEQRPHSFRHMEVTAEFTTSIGQAGLGVLTDWKAQRGLPYLIRDDGTHKELEWGPSQSDLVREFPDENAIPASRGAPKFITLGSLAEDSGTITATFGVRPVPDGNSDFMDGEYRVRVPYWALTPELSDGTDTNWWTIAYPWYVIFRATAAGMFLNRDDNAASFFQLAEREYQRARVADARSRVQGRTELAIRTGARGIFKGRPRTL